MKDGLLRQMKDIVGQDYVISSQHQVESYLYDQVEIPLRPKAAQDCVVVKPSSTQEISQIVFSGCICQYSAGGAGRRNRSLRSSNPYL